MEVETSQGLEARIRSHGEFLTSMANLGCLCLAVGGIALLASTYIPQDAVGWQAWLRDAESSAADSLTSKVLYSLSFVLLIASLMAPILALRKLGKVLAQGQLLSPAVAEAFHALARSVAKYYLLFQIAGGLIAAVARILGDTSSTSDKSADDFLTWLFLYIIACVCLYSVAHLMKLAAEAADDARSIV